MVFVGFAATISIWPPPSLEGGLGRELAHTEVVVFPIFSEFSLDGRCWFCRNDLDLAPIVV